MLAHDCLATDENGDRHESGHARRDARGAVAGNRDAARISAMNGPGAANVANQNSDGHRKSCAEAIQLVLQAENSLAYVIG